KKILPELHNYSRYKSLLLDEDEVVDVALKALFNATFFDKFSGGPLNSNISHPFFFLLCV
ncbi:hypothetical protein PSY31_24130, partial [Shigella flexneri]|nr:hypothetical protein [Shigella flexneri]